MVNVRIENGFALCLTGAGTLTIKRMDNRGHKPYPKPEGVRPTHLEPAIGPVLKNNASRADSLMRDGSRHTPCAARKQPVARRPADASTLLA